MLIPHFIYPHRHVGFHFLASMDNSAVNIRTSFAVGIYFVSLWNLARSGTGGSYSIRVQRFSKQLHHTAFPPDA